jgi:hypothetical protein
MEKIVKLIVDESVSQNNEIRFAQFLKNKSYKIAEYLNIREKHPGMPDFQILNNYIDNASIFLTSDRPFHNKVLSKGFLSFYINEQEITGKYLKGISIKPDVLMTKMNSTIKENYHPPSPEIRQFILPMSSSKLKKLTTKRRRIRNHFGGLENIDEIAVSLSLKPMKSKLLIGIKLQVSSNTGLKAITGSESYILEDSKNETLIILPIIHALITVVRLMLHSIKTIIYFDSCKIEFDREKILEADFSPYYHLFLALEKCFSNLTFNGVSKSTHIEMLKRKLNDLSIHKTNEITQGDISDIIQRMSMTSDVNDLTASKKYF